MVSVTELTFIVKLCLVYPAKLQAGLGFRIQGRAESNRDEGNAERCITALSFRFARIRGVG